MKFGRLRIADWPHAGPPGRAGRDRAPGLFRFHDRLGRSWTTRQAETVGLADDGIAGDAAAELLGDLAGRLPL